VSSAARDFEGPLIRAAAMGCLLVLVVAPLVVLGSELVSADAGGAFSATFGHALIWRLFATSVALALGVTLVALVLGVPMGVLVCETDVPGRWAALVLHCVPAFLPPFLLAFGWFHIFGRQGALGNAWTSGMLFSTAGVISTLGLALAPIVTVLTVIGLRAIDPSLEEAGRAVAAPARVITRISLPLAARSIALGAAIVFALALSEIGVPMFLGVKTYAAAVFTRMAGLDFRPGEATALVTPLVAVGAVLVLADRRWLGVRACGASPPRSRRTPIVSWGRLRAVVGIAVWTAALLPLLPLAALAAIAGREGFAAAPSWLGDSLSTSLALAATAATAIVALGIVVGHGLARHSVAGNASDSVAMLAFFVPSAVLGVGLIATWNRAPTHVVYTSSAILVIALAARYAVIGTRTLGAVFGRAPAQLEEAASVVGAPYLRRLTRVILPMHARAVIATWLLAFVFCLRDLDAVIVVRPPGLEPLPVRIFTLEANGPEEVVAALSIVHVAVTLAAVAGACWALGARRGAR